MVVVSLMLEFFSVAEWRDNAVIVTPMMPNYSGYVIVIFSVNSMGEKYRDAEGVVPYRCGGQDFLVAERYSTVGFFLRRANGVRPNRFVV